MEDRKKLTAMLRDFQAEQKELLAQAEQRLEVMTFKLIRYYSAKIFTAIFAIRNTTKN